MTAPLIPDNENQRLAELYDVNLLDTARDASFDSLTQLAAELFDVPIALVSLVDRDRQWFKSTYGLCAAETSRDVSFCSHVVYNQFPLVVQDARQDPRFADNPLVTGEPYIRFYAGMPIHSSSGFVLGTLCLIDTRPGDFDAASLERLRLLANQVEQLISLHQHTHSLAEDADSNRAVSARYQAIIQGAAAGVVRINGRGTMLEVNRFVCDMLGYSESELLGRNVKMLMPQSVALAHDGFLHAYQTTGDAKVIGKGREVEAQHKSGELIPVHLAISEVQLGSEKGDHEGRQFIGILSDLRDVHAARKREQKERALLEVLHQGLTDYRALVSGNTLWRFLKEALKELTQSEYALIGEVVLQDDRSALKIHAITDLSWNDESRRLMQLLVSGDMMLSNPHTMLGRVFAGGKIVLSNDMLHDERNGHLPAGHPVLTRYLGVPIIDRGQLIGMYAIANAREDYDAALVEWLKPFTSTCALLINLHRQLREQERFTEELRLAKEQAETASQAKTDFLSSMSHELRTPLNSILGFAQLLDNSRSPLPERQKRQAQQIIRSGRHLLQLINEVLDLARIESGNMQFSLEPVRAQDVLQDAIEIIQPLADERGLELHLPEAGQCAAHILGDYTRIKQVLINLLSNAVKYNRENGSIRVHCESIAGACRITVSDTGRGIPESRLDELFQPFNRLGAESGSIEGTGVGLALTRKVVDLMNGQMGVSSREGEGSDFWFELPLAADHGAELTDDEPGDMRQQAAALASTHQVLYIEDNPANQRLMQDLLADLPKVQLTCVADAEQGLELAFSESPDLILMDIDLPGMNGFAAQQILARNPLTRNIPVLAISAAASSANVRRAREAGFVDYLTKPFDIHALVDQVQQILAQGASQ